MSEQLARVLIVDRDDGRRAAAAEALRGAGCAIVEARSGEEALGRAAEGVDLAVVDVNLPDFDGFEVGRRIRALAGSTRLPIIYLAESFAEHAEKMEDGEAGIDACLTHPAAGPALASTAAALLRARHSEVKLRERISELEHERDSLHGDVAAARAEAERAQQLKDDFLATLSHELRSPLNAIVGWSELLKLGTLDADETQEGVEAIERNAKLQSQMISDLLDVSRLTSGKLRLEMQPVDLAAAVEAALETAGPAAAAKSVGIVREIDAHAGLASGDPARLEQVIWNLTSNAVKFTPEGGRVRVTLSRINSHLEITVADTGKGISADLLPYVFERFRQGDGVTTRGHTGLGLGLAISKQLVEMHGGTIRAESGGDGQGATFTVRLPVLPVPATRERPATMTGDDAGAKWGPASVRLSGIRVLVVDDDADARQLTRRVLSETGAETREVGSVPEALAAVDEYKPQVLVSDLGMPAQDGFELIRQVRSRGLTYHELPAVALTAFARTEDRRRALLAGYQVHLAKPVDPSELTAVIATLVGRTGGEA
jgi:signal transduction histidine kinase